MSAVQPELSVGPDGTVDVRLGAAWAAFEDALADAVGTRAPAESDSPGPSGFSIDRTLAALDTPSAGGTEAVITEGNAVRLLRRGDDTRDAAESGRSAHPQDWRARR